MTNTSIPPPFEDTAPLAYALWYILYVINLANISNFAKVPTWVVFSCMRFYRRNKIRKTQNEHLIIVCQNLIGLSVVF